MKLKDISKPMAEATENMTEGAFHKTADILSETKNKVREEMQRITSKEIKTIISNLNADKPISANEIELIKLWIIGDAESYTKAENNFPDWIEEFKRLQKVLGKYEDREYNAIELLKLHGILEDAIRVTYDILNFVIKRERAKKFNETVEKATVLNKEDKQIIAKILLSQMKSSTF